MSGAYIRHGKPFHLHDQSGLNAAVPVNEPVACPADRRRIARVRLRREIDRRSRQLTGRISKNGKVYVAFTNPFNGYDISGPERACLLYTSLGCKGAEQQPYGFRYPRTSRSAGGLYFLVGY